MYWPIETERSQFTSLAARISGTKEEVLGATFWGVVYGVWSTGTLTDYIDGSRVFVTPSG